MLFFRFGAALDDVICDDFTEDDVVPFEESATLPENDDVYSCEKQTYKDSPFYKVFHECCASVQSELHADGEVDGLPKNPLHVTGLVGYLLRHILPYYSLWSCYVQSILLPRRENPLSNSAVELMMRLDKQETLNGKRYQSARHVMVQMVTEAERRLDEVTYNTNFKRYKTTKKKEEKSPLKQPAIESWKSAKNARPPGGHYSKTKTAKYAGDLVSKVVRASKRQTNNKQKVRTGCTGVTSQSDATACVMNNE